MPLVILGGIQPQITVDSAFFTGLFLEFCPIMGYTVDILSGDGMKNLRFLVPNACTAFSMLLGLASVYASVNNQFDLAAWMVLWGVLLDKLDGTFARLLKASSGFGAQFDSFADFVSFGIAPAMLLLCAFGSASTAYPTVPQGWMMAASGVYVWWLWLLVWLVLISPSLLLERIISTAYPPRLWVPYSHLAF